MRIITLKSVTYRYIGIIHTPFTNLEHIPIQPAAAKKTEGRIEIFQEYSLGLRDLEGFSHIILLYHFHQAGVARLTVIPFLDQERGVFATRVPIRPNPIGLPILELVSRDNNVLIVKNVDILDGTPVIDIKPYVEKFDHPLQSRSGWLEGKGDKLPTTRADSRFKQAKI